MCVQNEGYGETPNVVVKVSYVGLITRHSLKIKKSSSRNCKHYFFLWIFMHRPLPKRRFYMYLRKILATLHGTQYSTERIYGTDRLEDLEGRTKNQTENEADTAAKIDFFPFLNWMSPIITIVVEGTIVCFENSTGHHAVQVYQRAICLKSMFLSLTLSTWILYTYINALLLKKLSRWLLSHICVHSTNVYCFYFPFKITSQNGYH